MLKLTLMTAGFLSMLAFACSCQPSQDQAAPLPEAPESQEPKEIKSRKNLPQTDSSKENPVERDSQELVPARKVSLIQIRPILKKHCLRCHNHNSTRSDLSLDSEIMKRAKDIVRRTSPPFNGMPSDRPKDVTIEEKKLLIEWENAGYGIK